MRRALFVATAMLCVQPSLCNAAEITGQFESFFPDRSKTCWTVSDLPASEFVFGIIQEPGCRTLLTPDNYLGFEPRKFEPKPGKVVTIGVLNYLNGHMLPGGLPDNFPGEVAETRLSIYSSGDLVGFLVFDIWNTPPRYPGYDLLCAAGYDADGTYNGSKCAVSTDSYVDQFRITLIAQIGSVHPLGFGEVLSGPDSGFITDDVPEPAPLALGLISFGFFAVGRMRRRAKGGKESPCEGATSHNGHSVDLDPR